MDSGIIFLFVSVLVIAVALLVMVSLTKRLPQVLDKSIYQQQWLTIQQSVKDDHGSMQLAILNADKLLDKALRQRGFAGETTGERMKSAALKKQFSQPQAIWEAHKLRNRIAHEEVQLDRRQTSWALQNFRRALRDLGAL